LDSSPFFIFLLYSWPGRPLGYDGNNKIIGKIGLYIPTISTFPIIPLKVRLLPRSIKKRELRSLPQFVMVLDF
jgi:hypothetical protein